MLAALLGWPQATFASKVVIADGKAIVTREIDGGLKRLRSAFAGGDHHRFAAERAALRDAAEHHEGEEEAAGHTLPRRTGSGRATAPDHAQGGGATQRGAGIKVADVAQLVEKLKNEAKVI